MRWGLAICAALVGCTTSGTPSPPATAADSGAAFSSAPTAVPVPAPSDSEPAPASPVAADAVEAHEPGVRQVASRKFVITTEPPGAEVYENGRRVCSGQWWPCEIVYTAGDAAPATPHKLYVSRGDLCDAQIKTVTLRDSPMHVKLKCVEPTTFWDGVGVPY